MGRHHHQRDDLTEVISQSDLRKIQQAVLAGAVQTNKQIDKMPVQKKTLGKAVGGAAAAKAARNDDNDGGEANVPAPKKRGLASLEAQFDSTPAGSGAGWPEGEYWAILTNAELYEKEGSDAISVCFTYTGEDDNEETRVANKDAKQYYQIMKDDGSLGAGVGFLKGDLEQLGYPDVPLSELEETLKDLTNAEKRCLVKVKQNGKYTNLYLQKVDNGDE